MADFVNSRRSRAKLIAENFVYQKEKLSVDGERVFWRCEKRNVCKARVHTQTGTDRIVYRLYEHTHAPEGAHVEVLKAIETMKERAAGTHESTGHVVTQATAGLSQAAKGRLPCQDLLKQQVRKVRREGNRPCQNPDCAANLVICTS